jgi:hypothetical protein
LTPGVDQIPVQTKYQCGTNNRNHSLSIDLSIMKSYTLTLARKKTFALLAVAAALIAVSMPKPMAAQDASAVKKFDQPDKFRQLEEILPTANAYRTASGAPGHDYWQQSADYKINVTVDDEKQMLLGTEVITYTNHSPDPLKYLWLQLDANIRTPHSDANLTRTTDEEPGIGFRQLQTMMAQQAFDGGVKISAVKDPVSGEPVEFTIVKTMMRIDLPKPLNKGDSFSFQVDWKFLINNARVVRDRTGYEYFEDDGNYLYEMAQWYPRLCAYNDVIGWQHKQYLGSGEFTLEFGNYEVNITVPNDHIVASTGVLQNPDEVLSDTQKQRLEQAKTAEKPVFIVTPEEATANESNKPEGTKTWTFKAENVRDFAFASSRKFIWDAMGHPQSDRTVMAMSYYPKEGEPLWSRYSTHAVVHTLEIYGKHTFEYPYPVAISVNGPIGGMEYPMICFNGPRPEKDGTYSARTKYGLISVVIHEVGHNWFPMIVNSDERQWTWMDEGLNTFLQYLAEQQWEEKYPSRRGEPKDIISFMKSTDQVPVMTNSESLHQFGSNAYAKPATALNILRETILGRELFDFAFKEYANRWKFKRPMPADFFRSMEDASGVDLDWFWRGWFYSVDHVDIAIAGVSQVKIDSRQAYVEKPKQQAKRDAEVESVSKERNKELPKRTERFPELEDFYNSYDELKITEDDIKQYKEFFESLPDDQKALMQNLPNIYVASFENRGGLVMPILLEIEFADGTTESLKLPAEIWRRDSEKVNKLIVTEKQISRIVVDPRLETADVDTSNNYFPPQIGETEATEGRGRGGRQFGGDQGNNPMRRAERGDRRQQNRDSENDRNDSDNGSGGN